jgi:hypothetical protein
VLYIWNGSELSHCGNTLATLPLDNSSRYYQGWRKQ